MPSYPTHHLSVVTWADTRDTLEKRRDNLQLFLSRYENSES